MTTSERAVSIQLARAYHDESRRSRRVNTLELKAARRPRTGYRDRQYEMREQHKALIMALSRKEWPEAMRLGRRITYLAEAEQATLELPGARERLRRSREALNTERAKQRS